MSYGIEEIENFRNELISVDWNTVLYKLNPLEKIDDLMSMVRGNEVTIETNYSNKLGKIAVVGASEVSINELRPVVRNLNFKENRFEFDLQYDYKFNFGKTRYNDKYSLILVGPMPHSNDDHGEYSSMIVKLEKEKGYPPVIRLGENTLKITVQTFRDGLYEALDKGFIDK